MSYSRCDRFKILMTQYSLWFCRFLCSVTKSCLTVCKLIDCSTEKAMAPHSSTLAWKIPWTEEPGGLQSMGSLEVGHDWATSLSLFTFMHWRRKWQPTPVFLPEESQGRGSLWAVVYGVAQSRTRLTWLSSSSRLQHTRLLCLPLSPGVCSDSFHWVSDAV